MRRCLHHHRPGARSQAGRRPRRGPSTRTAMLAVPGKSSGKCGGRRFLLRRHLLKTSQLVVGQSAVSTQRKRGPSTGSRRSWCAGSCYCSSAKIKPLPSYRSRRHARSPAGKTSNYGNCVLPYEPRLDRRHRVARVDREDPALVVRRIDCYDTRSKLLSAPAINFSRVSSKCDP
jgi:hypothetical protein